MAQKAYVAVHRIMTKAKPPTYVDAKAPFLMDEKEGDRLVGLGAATRDESAEIAEPMAAPKAAVKTKTKTKSKETATSKANEKSLTPEERIAKIKETMRGMGEADMTSAGVPDAGKVNDNLPSGVEKISAAERDAIWADIQAEDDLV